MTGVSLQSDCNLLIECWHQAMQCLLGSSVFFGTIK